MFLFGCMLNYYKNEIELFICSNFYRNIIVLGSYMLIIIKLDKIGYIYWYWVVFYILLIMKFGM